MMIDWATYFDSPQPVTSATEDEILAMCATALAPLSKAEIAAANAAHRQAVPNDTSFDAGRWTVNGRPFPESLLSFLRWSNGGEFQHGDRQFVPFFSTSEIREMLLGYELPEYMPGAVPIGFDGGGTFYLLDMRQDPVDGEYPILFCDAGVLDWEDAARIAESFPELCAGTSDPHDAPD